MSLVSSAGPWVAYVLAAVLLSSGLSKVVIPKYAVAAITELRLPRVVKSNLAIRLFALTEVAVGLVLALPYWRSLAASTTILIGVVFVVLGYLARGQQVTVGCGCFGRSDEPGLGVRTVGTGLSVTAGALVVVALGPQWSDAAPEAMAAVAVAVLIVVGVVNRKTIVDLLPRPLPNDQRFRSLE